MAPVPEGAQRSEDGHYWWDGSEWQQVPEDERVAAVAAAAGGGTADSGDSSGAGQISHEELAQITSEDQLDDRSKPYFQPDADAVPDDTSDAEGGDVLSDEPADGAGGS